MEEDQSKHHFRIECLDHVALRVEDLEESQLWYEKVLGLTPYKKAVWGEFPVFLLAGTTGIALFPANSQKRVSNTGSKHIKIDHFAFRVTNENFNKAKKYYNELKLDYQFQDHHFFHSIYTRDPDGHLVELTTLVVHESDFYQE